MINASAVAETTWKGSGTAVQLHLIYFWDSEIKKSKYMHCKPNFWPTLIGSYWIRLSSTRLDSVWLVAL